VRTSLACSLSNETDPGLSRRLRRLRLSEGVRKAQGRRFLSRAAEHEAELWAYDEKGEAAASVADYGLAASGTDFAHRLRSPLC
jgi:hypothetical protein